MKTQVILGKGKIMTGKRKASPIPLQFLNRRDMYTDLRARAAGDEDDGARSVSRPWRRRRRGGGRRLLRALDDLNCR
jgi:hypothetical protein